MLPRALKSAQQTPPVPAMIAPLLTRGARQVIFHYLMNRTQGIARRHVPVTDAALALTR
jgi:hypothetical protein